MGNLCCWSLSGCLCQRCGCRCIPPCLWSGVGVESSCHNQSIQSSGCGGALNFCKFLAGWSRAVLCSASGLRQWLMSVDKFLQISLCFAGQCSWPSMLAEGLAQFQQAWCVLVSRPGLSNNLPSLAVLILIRSYSHGLSPEGWIRVHSECWYS